MWVPWKVLDIILICLYDICVKNIIPFNIYTSFYILLAKEAWINEKRVLFEEELQRRILLGAEENEQKFEEEKRTILENAKEEQDTVEQQLRKQVAETKYAKQQMETKNEEAVRKLHVELEEAKSSIAVQVSNVM